MGADHPFEMVLLILICLFGIAISTKGTSFTIETNYLSNFLQFDSNNQWVVNINYHQFCSINKLNNHIWYYQIGPNLQNRELKLTGDISVQCNSDIDCPIGLICEKNACRKPGLVSIHTSKGIHTKLIYGISLNNVRGHYLN